MKKVTIDLSKKEKLLTPQEACQFLSIKMTKFRNAVFKKEIPYIKIGRLIRIDIDDIRKWIEINKVKAK